MNFDDMKDGQRVDQDIAEALEFGNIKSVQGEVYKLTSKGVTRVSIQFIQSIIVEADREKRDFRHDEKQAILEHLQTAMKALIG
jgi:hypothetical protein